MPNFRRGAEHIAKAQEAAGSGGNFKPFLPKIFWNEDGQEKCILVLNPLEEIPMVKVQTPWTTEGRRELVVARTDEAIGESKDPLEEEWGYPATDNNICIAIELDTEFEMKKGRKRPSGFTVKTRTFKRAIRDAKGEATDEKEEVTAPCVGFIAQSPNNFFNHISSQDANTAPIHETPALVRRVGDDKNTDYEVELFDDLEMDLTDLIELIENVSYLQDDAQELLDLLVGCETDEECAVVIGAVLLDKLLDERASQEYYDEVFSQVDQPARYPKKGWKKGGGSSDDEPKAERKSRTSQRRSRRTEEAPVEDVTETTTEDEGVPATEQEPPAEQPKTRRRSRSSQKEEEPKAAEEKVSKDSPVRARLEALKAKAEAAKAASA